MNRKKAVKYLSTTFNNFQIPYALIGSYAVSVWGVGRATQDIDFIASIPQEKTSEIISRLRKQGFQTDLRHGDPEDPIAGILKLTYINNDFKESIDVLLGIKGLSKEIYMRTKILNILDTKIPVISPEDLVISKLLAGGPVDIEDASKVIKIMKEKINLDYIKTFCKNKGLKLPL